MSAIPSSTESISSKDFSIEARLDLSLDQLIKERKKEDKAKKLKTGSTRTLVSKQKSKQLQKNTTAAVKKHQSQNRQALLNKKRGLSALPTTVTSSMKTANKASPRSKRIPSSLQEKSRARRPTTSKLQHKMPINTRILARHAERNVISPKASSTRSQPQWTKRQQELQSQQQRLLEELKKVVQKQQEMMHKKSPKVKIPGGAVTKQARKVVRPSGNKSKLKVTIQQAASSQHQRKITSPQNTMKNRTQQARLLPGKTSSKVGSKQRLAGKVVKYSQLRKQSSKNGKFILRKPFVARKMK